MVQHKLVTCPQVATDEIGDPIAREVDAALPPSLAEDLDGAVDQIDVIALDPHHLMHSQPSGHHQRDGNESRRLMTTVIGVALPAFKLLEDRPQVMRRHDPR